MVPAGQKPLIAPVNAQRVPNPGGGEGGQTQILENFGGWRERLRAASTPAAKPRVRLGSDGGDYGEKSIFNPNSKLSSFFDPFLPILIHLFIAPQGKNTSPCPSFRWLDWSQIWRRWRGFQAYFHSLTPGEGGWAILPEPKPTHPVFFENPPTYNPGGGSPHHTHPYSKHSKSPKNP